MAACSGHADTVQCLIDKGAGINIENTDGVSEWDCNGDQSLSTQVPDKGSGISLYNKVHVYCQLDLSEGMYTHTKLMYSVNALISLTRQSA